MEKPKSNLYVEIGSIVSKFGLIILRDVVGKNTEKIPEDLILKFNHAHEKAVQAIVDAIKAKIGL